ncbi:MAG: hypothetical protein N4A35_00895 [Flavobacteriales bacterium]|jgi:hypothetical protein|nr:hypothetical protein [Flavobacteriales bacterium]
MRKQDNREQSIRNLEMKNTSFLNKIRRSRYAKAFMAFVGVNMLSQIVLPTAAMALTSGAASPEFASFEPVATTNMVNDFTGDFTYNLPVLSVPGPDGGGYSMSLSYHSGASPEEEASWVGFGWTLNPGAINRNKRGYADDFNGVKVTKYNKVKPNWTSGSTFDFNVEYNSADDSKDKRKEDREEAKAAGSKFNFFGFNLASWGGKMTHDEESSRREENGFSTSVSFSNAIRYNNYSGFSTVKGFSASTMQMASLNMNRSGGENTYGVSIRPLVFLSKSITALSKQFKNKEGKVIKALKNLANKLNKISNNSLVRKSRRYGQSFYSSWSFNAPAVPYSIAKNVGAAYNVSYSTQINPYGPIGFQTGVKGSMNAQANIAEEIKEAYGYLHNPQISSYESKDNLEADYQIEKATTFNKHDHYLGIPFNNADLFSATGNGVVGGFQVHHEKVGHFYPCFITNEQDIRQVGVEAGWGGTLQVGLDVGVGFQKTRTMDWRKVDNNNSVDGEVVKNDLEFDQTTSSFMRFNGDMGGEVSYTGDELLHATVGGTKLNAKLNLDNLYQSTTLDEAKEKQTSYIAYATYDGDGLLTNPLDENVGVRTMDGVISQEIIDKNNSNYKDLIGQIAVTDKSGNKSTYGLPVFSTEETQLTIGVTADVADYITYSELEFENPLQNKTVSGSRIEVPYASTYLLTNTTTFDYVDADNIIGPSEGDFGGWTKFNYRQAHNDYRYRAPYTGLFYNRGRLTDPNDQTGSMSSGKKEVNYLESIETKTHIAYFVTNKTDCREYAGVPEEAREELKGSLTAERPDGLSAYEIDDLATKDGAANNETYKGSKHLEKLEKIVLYAKNDYSRPISVTYFEYDQSLCNGIPNTDATGTGKLTLKKVWTEGGGVSKTRIAPYQFKYEYFRDYSSTITDKYSQLTDVYTKSNGTELATSLENPNYKQGLLDMWGNYQINASERFKKMQPWLDQTIEGGEDYDPAAWQLKQIILPSGGAIHIQYEQKDYLNVQDKRAMVMTPLLKQELNGEDGNTYISKENHDNQNFYYIDLEKIGITDPNDIEPYKDLLESTFIDEHQKLYFKMLYHLRNGNAALDNTGSDYISGYTSVSEVVLDNKGTPSDKSDDQIFLRLGNNEVKKDKTLPRFLAYKKLLSNSYDNLTRHQSLKDEVLNKDENILAAAYRNDGNAPSGAAFSSISNDNSDSDNEGINLDEKNFRVATRKVAIRNTFDFFGEWISGGFTTKKNEVCKNYNPSLSYFKLPTYHSKKGGGIRVKRLLSYDPGVETGDEMVYGSEYIYKLSEFSGLSSGVATNEPALGREENALVEFLEPKKQKWLNKVTKGRNSKQFEGPLGESLLPGASIGYSRVIVKNIHSGKTTTGYAVNEYHTVKDYPMTREESKIDKDEDTYKKFNMSLPLGVVSFDVHKAWVTQGYLFKLNDMHGKPKAQSTYAGNYDVDHPEQHLPMAYTARTTYNYSALGDEIKSLVYDPNDDEFEVGTMRPGYEEDLTLYRSRVKDRTNDFSLELDLNITMAIPPPITINSGLSYAYTENQFSQHVTSKVLRQKTYLLSTTSTVDGVTQTTENLAFNKHTGDPVLTRTYDGYKGKTETINTNKDAGEHNAHYYALNIPASWVYEDLRHKSENDAHSNQLTANVGSVVTYGDSPINLSQSTISSPTFEHVVSASAVVLEKGWFSGNDVNDVVTEYGIQPNDITTLNNHYYPLRSYVFRDKAGVKHSVNPTSRNSEHNIYGGGTAVTSLAMFPWLGGTDFKGENSEEINNYWFSASKVNKYSPNGIPLEEQDVLDINSTAHFGYSKTLPTLVAQNASYKEVAFKDYENDASASVIAGEAHSGNRSLAITYALTQNVIENYNLSSAVQGRGLTMKLWLKSKQSNDYDLKNPNPNLKAVFNNQTFDFKRIAQTGEWSLFEARILSNQLSNLPTGLYNIGIMYNHAPGAQEKVYIDDVRIQPLDAVMNCTVYTKDNRVAAQFDDQHFGVFYEYNREGQLVRKSIETERGRKTVQEQQHNVPQINK